MERINQITSQLVPSPCSAAAEVFRKDVIRVLITGAAGQIAYSLIPLVISGETFGPTQKIILHLLDIPAMAEKLHGVVMEIEDCAYPLLHSVVATTNEPEAFKDVDVALFVGAMPRLQGMERKDLLQKNAQIFKVQGKSLDTYASKNVKVLVVGNPANTNCLIAQTFAPSIPKGNFTALTRLDQNRARSQIALKLKVPVQSVQGVNIWGNHSATQYPDAYHGMVENYPAPGLSTPVSSAINDENWIQKTFIQTVQQRGAAVINARKSSSAVSAAKAISDHVRDWILGSDGKAISMGVSSDGSYGIAPGLIYSFPVICSRGTYRIVQGLKLDTFSQKALDVTTKELLEEKTAAGL